MTPGTFKGIDKLVYALAGICAVSVPFGLWKLAEIVLALFGK
jgi:hypothetical protein